MIDIQNEAEGCGIPLNYVGVSDFKIPIRINKQPTIAKVKFGISLDEYHKGIHMSRLCKFLNKNVEKKKKKKKKKKSTQQKK